MHDQIKPVSHALSFLKNLAPQTFLCVFFCAPYTFSMHQKTIQASLSRYEDDHHHYHIFQAKTSKILAYNHSLFNNNNSLTYLMDAHKNHNLLDLTKAYHILLFSDFLHPQTLLFDALKQKHTISSLILSAPFPKLDRKNSIIGSAKKQICLQLKNKAAKKKGQLIIEQLKKHQKQLAKQVSHQFFEI